MTHGREAAGLGGEPCSSCITSSGSHTRQPQKEVTLRLRSWEGTEPLDSEWSTVLGRGLYQPGVSVNHSLSSEACEPRDRQDEEGLEGPIRGSVALTGETCVQKLER